MIIIKLQGGLGNQLFLYGLYKSFKALGREVKIDEVSGMKDDELRSPCLDLLGISYEKADMDEVDTIRDAHMDPFHRIKRGLFGRHSLEYQEPIDGNFDPHVLELTDAYLSGYFQSEKYFEDEEVKSELRKEICSYEVQEKELQKEMKSCQSVSLHIRRGDYLAPGIYETYSGICTEDYYRRSMDYVKEQYPGAVFYVFSNDMDYCRQLFDGEDDVKFVRSHAELSDIEELFLMASCSHHILANSSYSWWGAWLGNHDGITIAPTKWLNNKNLTDIYTSYMTII